MPINFYVAENTGQAIRDYDHAVFDYDDESLHDIAQAEKIDDSLLWDLNPYDNTIIAVDHVPPLADLCTKLRVVAPRHNVNPELTEFLIGLESLCRIAMQLGKPLLAVGD